MLPRPKYQPPQFQRMSLVTEPEKTRAAAPMSIDPATPARTLGVTDHQLVRGTRTPIPSEPETLSDPPARTQLTGRSSSTAVSVPSKYAYPVNADTHYI